jgi:predicted nucleotidyltransferase
MANDELANHLLRIVAVGTQVVSRLEIKGRGGGVGRALHPVGVVGTVVAAPADHEHAYRVRFPDGFEASLRRHEFVTLRDYQRTGLEQKYAALEEHDLATCVIYQCVIGSRAYGLEEEGSDTDRRGVYLPPAELHWSLYGVPEQLENVAGQECYWELQKFLTLGLKANPNVLECLYSPVVEKVTALGEELVGMRGAFLSRLVYQTYNGYVLSQFKKLQGDLRNKGEVKWKHVMHLIRLLLAGIGTLREGVVPVRVERDRAALVAIKRGEMKWEEVERWRLALHAEFDAAAVGTGLPERPDYEGVNAFLVRARRSVI